MRTRFEIPMVLAVVAAVVIAAAGLVLATRVLLGETRGSPVTGSGGAASGEPVADPMVMTRIDEASAADAAVSFVRSTGEAATAGPLTRRDALLAIATDSYGPRFVESVNRDLDGLLAALGERGLTPGDLLWVEYPLTATATLTADGRADAQVWSVLVIGVEGGSLARQLWRTSHLTLEWEGQAWKVAGWATTAGPSPALTGEADVATVDAVRDTTGWDDAGVGR